MRILVVDDEEHLRRMMRLTLEAAGYEVEEAADGEGALRCSATALASMRRCSTSGCLAWTAWRRSGG